MDFSEKAVSSRGNTLHGYCRVRDGKAVSEHFAAPYERTLPHPLGAMGRLIAAAAVSDAINRGILSSESTLRGYFPEEAVREDIGQRTVGELINSALTAGTVQRPDRDWKAAVLTGIQPETPDIAAAFLSAVLQRVTGDIPSRYLWSRTDYLPAAPTGRFAFLEDGTEFSAGIAMTAENAALFLDRMRRDGMLPVGNLFPAMETEAENWGACGIIRPEETVLLLGVFPEPEKLAETVMALPDELPPLLPDIQYDAPGQNTGYFVQTFLPAARIRFPSVRELIGGYGVFGGNGGGILSLKITIKDDIRLEFMEEDGPVRLRFGQDRFTVSKTPVGIFAGCGGFLPEGSFAGVVYNLEAASGTVLRLEKTEMGLLLKSGAEWTLQMAAE